MTMTDTRPDDVDDAGEPIDGRPAKEYREVTLAQLRPDPDNLRLGNITDDSVKGLCASIVTNGILQSLDVRLDPEVPDGDHFVIRAGHRRYAAAQLGVRRTLIDPAVFLVPVLVDTTPADTDERKVATDVATAITMLVENLQREDLDPVEEAHGYSRLLGFGVIQKDIARRTGQTAPHISKRLKLLQLPPKGIDAVRKGDLHIEDALKLADLEDHELVVSFITDGWYRGDIERAVADQEKEKAKAKAVAELENQGLTIVRQDEIRQPGMSIVYGTGVPAHTPEKLKLAKSAVGVEIYDKWDSTQGKYVLFIRGLRLEKIKTNGSAHSNGSSSSPATGPKESEEERKERERAERRAQRALTAAKRDHHLTQVQAMVGGTKKADLYQLLVDLSFEEPNSVDECEKVARALGLEAKKVDSTKTKRGWELSWTEALKDFMAEAGAADKIRFVAAVGISSLFWNQYETFQKGYGHDGAILRAYVEAAGGIVEFDPDQAVADVDDGDEELGAE